jgi:anti-sigma factor RsiW
VIFSTFWLGDAAGSANVFFLVLILAFLGPIYLVPLLGVHRRLAAAKQAELDRVNERIRDAVSVEGAAPVSQTRLADWIAYRRLVEHSREWPLNAPALVRTLLFVALGMGSWLGGALVERLLGAVIG